VAVHPVVVREALRPNDSHSDSQQSEENYWRMQQLSFLETQMTIRRTQLSSTRF